MSEIAQVDYDELEVPTIDYDRILTEDDAPMDNLFSERQMDLLKESLYASWPGPGDGRPFVVMTNVGLFYAEEASPLVPDVLVSLDVELPADPFPKPHRSYFIWRYGKPPDIVMEIVSNRKGSELGNKLLDYARLGAAYYIVYDPEQHLGNKSLRIFGRESTIYREHDDTWLADIGLGVTLWHGPYQGMEQTWLRWCDHAGNMLLTGDERAEQEHQRAEQEHQRAERLAEKLRARGVDPDA